MGFNLSEKNSRLLCFAVMVLSILLTRWMPHPWNMTPVTAIALFAGARAPKWGLGLGVLLLGMLISDLYLGFYSLLPVTYLSLGLSFYLGRFFLRGEKFSMVKSAAVGLIGPTQFFLVTNFAVWAMGTGYPKTMSGLMSSYVMGLPFYQGHLIGTFVYGAAIMALWSALEQRVLSPAAAKA